MAIPFDAEEIRNALQAEISDIVREDAEAITRAVVLATPVGNPALWASPAPAGYKPGTHRGNWRISFGTPNASVLNRRDTTGGPTIAEAFQRIREWTRKSKRLGRHPRLILENNAPAIGRLNTGWSTQAPAGFIDKAVAIGRQRSDTAESKELP